MANYAEALDRVRQQAERNYANREEGDGAIQGVFNGILNQLNQDLDPNNVEKPLSIFGQALDSIVPFKQRQIEDAANLQAQLAQAKFTAEAPVRAEGYAERLEAQLKEATILQKKEAVFKTDEALQTLRVDEESNRDFIRTAVENNPALAKTIVSRSDPKNRHLFQVIPEGVEPGIKAGEKIYTHPITGQQLYSTSDVNAINLNYHHSRLGKTFREKLEKEGFSPEELRNLSFEAREKLFSNKDFKEVLKETVGSISPELLESHEIYNQALNERTKQINDVLKTRYTMIEADIRKNELIRATAQKEADRKSQAPEYVAVVERQDIILKDLKEKRLRVELDGRFQDKIRAMVHKKAFALSLLKKEEVRSDRAKINIDRAIRLTMNDPELKAYKEQLEFFYGTATDKVGTASTSSAGISTNEVPLAAGHGKVPSLATNPVSLPLRTTSEDEVP